MKVVVLTDSEGKVQGVSVVNGDERGIERIVSVIGTGLVDLRCQVVEVVALWDLCKFVQGEFEDVAADLESGL